MWGWQMRTTSTFILIPEANCSLRAIGLYFVYYRLARLTAIRSGETAFYSLVCQLQTYAMLLFSARIFIRLLLDYFLSNILSQACLYWELWTSSVSPSDRNLSICGLHSLIPLKKYPSPFKTLYYELNKYICIHEFLIVSHWSLNWGKIKRKKVMGYWNCLNDLGEINYVVGRDLGREDPEHLEIEIQSWRLWFQEEDTVRKTKEMKV